MNANQLVTLQHFNSVMTDCKLTTLRLTDELKVEFQSNCRCSCDEDYFAQLVAFVKLHDARLLDEHGNDVRDPDEESDSDEESVGGCDTELVPEWEAFPLATESLKQVTLCGHTLFARTMNDYLYECYVRYEDNSQAQVFADDFVGYYDYSSNAWDELKEGYEWLKA